MSEQILKLMDPEIPQDHIHYHLLEIAKNRLLATNDSVKEFAYSLGFKYPNYFSNLFKNKTGMNPSDYRSRH